MSKDIEEIARALYEVSAEPEHGDSWETTGEAWRDNFRRHAQAAYSVMEKRLGELEDLIFRYGDRVRMARAEPASLQQAIDQAMSNASARNALNNESKPVENGR